VLVVVGLIGRHEASSGSSNAYGLKLGPGDVLRTLGEQLFAALPLSYVLKAPGDLPFLPHSALLTHMSLAAFVFGVVAGGLTYVLLRGEATPPPEAADRRSLGLVDGIVAGAATWFLAAFPIALSQRYQQELVWGTGHIPVFMEVFGVALLLVCAGVWLLRRVRVPWLRSAITLAAALALGLTASVTWGANHKLTDRLHESREYHYLFERSLEEGLLDGVPEHGRLIDAALPGYYPLEPFYFQHTDGRRFDLARPRPNESWDAVRAHHPEACGPRAGQGAYWVSESPHYPSGPDLMAVTCLGTPTAAAADGRPSDRLYARRVDDDVPFLVIGGYAKTGGEKAAKSFAKLSTELGVKPAGSRARMLDLPRNGTPVSPATINAVLHPDPGVPIWGGGCSSPPGTVALQCYSDGDVTLVNSSNSPRRMKLTGTANPSPKPATLRIGGRAFAVAHAPVPFALTVTVAPRSTKTLPVTGIPASVGGMILNGLGVDANA
jgi:hypothetical protein